MAGIGKGRETLRCDDSNRDTRLSVTSRLALLLLCFGVKIIIQRAECRQQVPLHKGIKRLCDEIRDSNIEKSEENVKSAEARILPSLKYTRMRSIL